MQNLSEIPSSDFYQKKKSKTKKCKRNMNTQAHLDGGIFMIRAKLWKHLLLHSFDDYRVKTYGR